MSHFAKATFIFFANMMLCANKLRSEGLDVLIDQQHVFVYLYNYNVILYTNRLQHHFNFLISIGVYVCNVYRIKRLRYNFNACMWDSCIGNSSCFIL